MDKVLRILRNAFCIIVAGLFLFIAVVTICGAKGYSIASNSMNPKLSKGDVVFVDGGVPHAIGGGSLILELQEPTDLMVCGEKVTPSGRILADEKVRAVYLGRGKFHKSGKVESAKGGQNA